MSFLIETDEIFLRQFKPSDHEFIKFLDSDPEVMKFISNGIPSDQNEIERAMGVFLSYQAKYAGQLGYWIAQSKAEQRPVGWFHLRPLKSNLDDLENLELGYRLLQKDWGKGIASSISKRLIDYGFNKLNAINIYAHAMERNLASQAVMQKCGMEFSHQGVYEEFPGKDKLTVWYVINKDNFNSLGQYH